MNNVAIIILQRTCALALLVIPLVLAGCGKDKGKGVFHTPTPAEEARNLFNVYDADVRRNAINSLSAAPFGGESPYVRSYRLLVDDPDPTVRAAAIRALGLHGEVADAVTVAIRLRDVSTMVRWEAAQALQKIHNLDVIKPLTAALLNDDDSDVRQAAATALGQYAQPEVFNTLVAALSDPQHSVVHAAGQSLELLTGQNLGTDGAAWIRWSDSNRATLFAQQKPYRWTPYQKPRGMLDKAAFWKKPKPVVPQAPIGAPDSPQTSGDAASAPAAVPTKPAS